jgi:hypothetical protein
VICVDLVGSRRIWPARLGASSIPPDLERPCRIVWMIKRMIKFHPNGWPVTDPCAEEAAGVASVDANIGLR